MSTWIVWSPQEKLEEKFPGDYLQGDPMGKYQTEIETESCVKCKFTVRWLSDKYQFENYNSDIHILIASILKRQSELGDCPTHPKPNWIA